MKIALVHDYLNEAGGAERVLKVLAQMYPKAPIYTAFAKNGSAKQMFDGREIRESKWAWFLKIGRFYSYFRFFLPLIWRSIDLSDFDLVITSTSGGYIARGFKVSEKTKVIAYCHTPPKWLYGYETPTGAMGKWWGKIFMWIFGPFLRYFDFQSAQRVDIWMANSKEVAGRVEKFYRKSSEVVYPPIEIENNNFQLKKKNYYLLVTRVTGAKGVIETVEAAKLGGFELKIVGEIVEERIGNEVRELAGENVTLLGRVNDRQLAQLYSEAKGFIALARDEDFGMTVVEAMAHGTPVLALHEGGYKETVLPGKTGLFVHDTKPNSVIQGIKQMDMTNWNTSEIKKWASKFGRARFEKEVRKIVGI